MMSLYWSRCPPIIFTYLCIGAVVLHSSLPIFVLEPLSSTHLYQSLYWSRCPPLIFTYFCIGAVVLHSSLPIFVLEPPSSTDRYPSLYLSRCPPLIFIHLSFTDNTLFWNLCSYVQPSGVVTHIASTLGLFVGFKTSVLGILSCHMMLRTL